MLGRKTVCILVLLLITVSILTSCADPYRQPYYSSSGVEEKVAGKSTFGSNSIKDLLSSDDKFVFVTSRTEPGESTKAYLFSTDMSVPDAANYIKNKRKPFETSDMNSSEKIILTYDDEYVMVYQVDNKEDKKETIVQASTRQYVYSSRQRGLFNPYRSTVFIPYPVYYERNLLNRDMERYRGYTSTKKSVNTGSTSSKSVRTGSTGSNFNRGGGTGVGK